MRHFGPHATTNRSVDHEEVDQLASLDGDKAIDVMHTDPPWGDANIKYWATINRKMTGAEAAPMTYDAMLDRIYQLIERYVCGHAIVLTGTRWEEQVADGMADLLYGVRTYRILYRASQKWLPHIAVTGRVRPYGPDVGDPGNQVQYEAAKAMTAPVAIAGGSLIDPFCGKGRSARLALEHGMRFRGNELNAKRLAHTEAYLKRSASEERST